MTDGVWQRARFESDYEEHVYYVDGESVGEVVRVGLNAWHAEWRPNETDTMLLAIEDEETGKAWVESRVKGSSR